MKNYTEVLAVEAGFVGLLLFYEVFVPVPPKAVLKYAVLLFKGVVLGMLSLLLQPLIQMKAPRYVLLLLTGGLILYVGLLIGQVITQFPFTDRTGTPGTVRGTPWYQDAAFALLTALISFDIGYLMQHAFSLPEWSTDVLAIAGGCLGYYASDQQIGCCPWCGREVGALWPSCRHCGQPYFNSDGKLQRGKG